MWERCKVVILPTEEKATFDNLAIALEEPFNCLSSIKKGNLSLVNLSELSGWKPQHLYILSDDEIKEGDWFYDIFSESIKKCFEIPPLEDAAYKIIASTDPSLYTKINPSTQRVNELNPYLLPSPSQSFIEKYVSEYNKGNIITEVMVEYELDLIEYKKICIKHLDVSPVKDFYEEADKKAWKLKINSKNNAITIKEIKDNWSREELNKEAMKFYKKYHGILNQGDMQSIAKFIDEL